jgi:hypothetical protein
MASWRYMFLLGSQPMHFRLQAISKPYLLALRTHERNPGIGIWKQDQVGSLDLISSNRSEMTVLSDPSNRLLPYKDFDDDKDKACKAKVIDNQEFRLIVSEIRNSLQILYKHLIAGNVYFFRISLPSLVLNRV